MDVVTLGAAKADAKRKYAMKAALPQNTAVLLGDSFQEFGGGPKDPAAPTSWDAKGIFAWCNYYLGQRLKVVKQSGVGGEQMSAFLARVPADVDAYSPGWVIGMGGLNDITQGRTTAQIIADFTTLFNYLIATKGYRVSWNTITVVSGWTNPQYKICSEVNRWLSQAPQTWPGLVVPDALSAVLDPATGSIPATYRVDATHLNPAGAARVGKVMADAIAPILPPVAILESQNGTSGSSNLISNGRFQNPASGLAANWAWLGTPTVTASVVARTDIPGQWQRAVFTGTNGGTFRATIPVAGTAVVPGTSKVRFAVESRVANLDPAPANDSQRWGIRLDFYNASSVLLSGIASLHSDGSYDNVLISGASGILATPDFVVPATTATIYASIRMNGGGDYDWDRATLTIV